MSSALGLQRYYWVTHDNRVISDWWVMENTGTERAPQLKPIKVLKVLSGTLRADGHPHKSKTSALKWADMMNAMSRFYPGLTEPPADDPDDVVPTERKGAHD